MTEISGSSQASSGRHRHSTQFKRTPATATSYESKRHSNETSTAMSSAKKSGKDYYQILGVGKGATVEEIKAAYKKQALRWHPDRNRDNPALSEQKFKELGEAVEVLTDSNKR